MAKNTIGKRRAMSILSKLEDRIEGLRTLNANSAIFLTWKEEVETAIINCFGDESRHLRTFENIDFSPPILKSKILNTEKLKADAFLVALNKSKAFLEALGSEINQYWEDDFIKIESEDRPKSPMKKPVPREIREEMVKQNGNKCSYCFRTLPTDLFVLDQFFPASKYPQLINSPENLIVCCSVCNSKKRDRDPNEFPIFNIKKDKFEDHFIEDSTGVITAKTQLGGNSLSLFDINNREYIEFRKTTNRLSFKNSKTSSLQYIATCEFLVDTHSEKDYVGGREEFAEVVSEKVNRIFSHKDYKGSFMIHIEGKWGSGKTTYMNFLRKELQKNKKWVIVDFDAWRYQHFIPTWWGFLEQIKIGIYKESSCCRKRWLDFILLFYRFKKIIGIPFFIGLASAIYSIFEFQKDDFDQFAYVLAGVSVAAFIKPFKEFYQSSVFLNARKIKEYVDSPATDPYEIASEYFHTLVENGKGTKQHLAIFIDDLDRCQPSNAIKLLEGIQTLFKNGNDKILYVVGADKVWLKNCFENEFKDLKGALNESLGSHFLEKMFQVNTRLPNSNKRTEKSLIDKVLGIENEPSKFTTDTNLDVESDLSDEGDEEGTPYRANVNDVSEESNSARFIKEIELEKTHLVTKFHSYLGSNPRSLKRILNAYEMRRHLISLELEKEVLSEHEMDSIMKCSILEQRWPDVMDAIECKLISRQDFHFPMPHPLNLGFETKYVTNLSEDNHFVELFDSLKTTDYLLYLGIR